MTGQDGAGPAFPATTDSETVAGHALRRRLLLRSFLYGSQSGRIPRTRTILATAIGVGISAAIVIGMGLSGLVQVELHKRRQEQLQQEQQRRRVSIHGSGYLGGDLSRVVLCKSFYVHQGDVATASRPSGGPRTATACRGSG